MSKVSQNRTVTGKEAARHILRCVKIKRPLMLWGPPGVGKSSIVEQICNDLGGRLYDMRLPLLEPTDLRGMPYYNKDINMMDWAPPIDLPTEEDAAQYPIVFLLLDEINGAAPAVQAAAYQLILNRRVGKYVLPKNVVIIAAGNRDGDKGVTYRMPAPLANRFVHLELRVDFESWLEWAVKNRVHKDVVGYLTSCKNDLFDFDPRSPSRSFASPRSWEFVSELVRDGGSESELVDLVCGTVGDGTGIKFMTQRKFAEAMPNPSDILSGKVTDLKTKEISAMYSLVTSMCYELQDSYDRLAKTKDLAKWHPMADCFFEYMMNNFSTEIVVMGARVALTVYSLQFSPAKMKSFEKLNKTYGKYIINATNPG